MTVHHIPGSAGLGALLVWLGGAEPQLTDGPERGGYTVTGAVVALFAATAGAVTAAATGAARWPVLAIVAIALIATALLGAVARALATAATPDRRDDRRAVAEFGGRIAVAGLAGVLVAELACTLLFSGTVNRLLDENAQHAVESAPAVVLARTDLDQAKAARGALDQQITKAQDDVATALRIARCEYNPNQDCAQIPKTGVPGRGPEERTANQMLDDARNQLTAAQGRVDGLDATVTEKDKALTSARKAAYTDGDRGLGARWVAMNDYTTGHVGPFVLRLAVSMLMIVLALLPLLLRWWRGETAFDRSVAVRTAADRVDQAAAIAIAVKQAEVRVETESLRAEQQLTAARLAAHADTAIDRERQRTRIIAAIGSFEIGITEPAQRAVAEFDSATRQELPAGSAAGDRKDSTVSQEGIVTQSPNLPAQLASGALAPVPQGGALVPAVPVAEPANKGGGLELPIIGTVPFTDTAARWIRPLVPSFVANAIDTATHPLRTVRQAFEEAEEITFTLRRTRKVTVDSEDSAQPQHQQVYAQPQYGYLPQGAPQQVHAQRVASAVVDQPYAQYPAYAPLPQGQVVEPGHPLPAGAQQDALAARRNPELDYRSPRELPPGKGRE
ncbi:DUF4407 domain-containing protein [Nocardia niigatensis]